MDNLYGITKVSIHAALEIDNYLIGRNNNFDSVKSLTKLFEENSIKSPYTVRDGSGSLGFYLMLKEVFEKDSDKEINHVSELALEMKLLQSEFNFIPNLSKEKLEYLRSVCLDLSKISRNYYQKR